MYSDCGCAALKSYHFLVFQDITFIFSTFVHLDQFNAPVEYEHDRAARGGAAAPAAKRLAGHVTVRMQESTFLEHS